MKKQILFLLGGVVIVAALVAIGWFFLTAPTPTVEDVQIEGTWKVCKENNTEVAQEYMIFTSTHVTDSREGEIYFESEYSVEGHTLSLSDLSVTFEITSLSEHQLVLSGSDGSRRELMAVDGTTAPPEEALLGEWRVVLHAGKAGADEYVTISADTICDHRGGKKYLESPYIYREGVIVVEGMDMELEAYTAGETLMLYERDGGYIWELERMEARDAA